MRPPCVLHSSGSRLLSDGRPWRFPEFLPDVRLWRFSRQKGPRTRRTLGPGEGSEPPPEPAEPWSGGRVGYAPGEGRAATYTASRSHPPMEGGPTLLTGPFEGSSFGTDEGFCALCAPHLGLQLCETRDGVLEARAGSQGEGLTPKTISTSRFHSGPAPRLCAATLCVTLLRESPTLRWAPLALS